MKFSFALLAVSALLASTVSASLVSVKNTDVKVKKAVNNVANDLDAHGALGKANVDAVSHVLSKGGDHRDD